MGGAGSYFTDTSIPTNTRIMRVTTPADSATGNSLAVPALGDRNVWSVDGTHFIYMDVNWGTWWIRSVNVANWPNPSTLGARIYLPLGGPYFSYTNPDLVYGMDAGGWASSYRLSTGTITHLFNFGSIPGWNNSLYALAFTLSSDDRLMCAFNASGQDNGYLVACMDTQTNTSYLLDTSKNTVNGSPTNGYAFTAGTGAVDDGIHELDFGMSNRYLQIQALNGNPPVYWDLGSPRAAKIVAEWPFTDNHSAGGYNGVIRGHGPQCVNLGQSDSRDFTLKPYNQMGDQSEWTMLNSCVPTWQQSWDDENHWSWTNNSDAIPALTDKYPVFANITMHSPHYPQQWIDGELVAFQTDGVQQRVWHFLHNYTSYASWGCPAYLVSPHVSRDGRWVLFNSDWMGTLGAGADCNNRMDVFLAELKTDVPLPAAVSVSLSPPNAAVVAGQAQQFAATVNNTGNSVATGVTWSLNPAVGALSAAGLYTAPGVVLTQQSVTITATSVADPTKSAGATLTVLPPVSVSVTPGSVNLNGGQTQQFSAAVSNTINTAVAWSVASGAGTISPAGLYTAPATIAAPQTVTVTATSAADTTKSASASVVLVPVTISASPASVTLGSGQTQQFTAAVSNTSNTSVTWSIAPAMGAVSVAGLYTAPATITTQQAVTITATSAADPTKSASATITLIPPVAVAVTPATTSLIGGQSQQFAASVSNASNTGVTWSISPAVGTLSAAGLYTAPAPISTQQTVTITATSVADPMKSASVTVTLVPPVGISVSPGNVTLGGGQWQRFTATVTNASYAGATWSMSPQVGTLTLAGVYIAPAAVTTQQSVTITATSVADPTKSASVTVTLTQPVSVSITPATATLIGGQSQQFAAAVISTANTAVTWSLSPPAGTISAFGLYTAPPAVGLQQTVTVTATSVADPTKSASAVVTLLPVAISITPGNTTLTTGQWQRFTAAVTNAAYGGATWSMSPQVGTLSLAGLYMPPATITSRQTVTITATSVADPSKSATVTATLAPPVSVSVTPSNANLIGGQWLHLGAAVFNASKADVTWSMSPAIGTLTPAGLYTAPAIVGTPQTVTITATSVADPTKSASAVLTLVPVAIAITPGDTTLTGGQWQRFTSVVTNANYVGATWSMSPQAGTLSLAGLYIAPAVVTESQTVTITVTAVADPSKTASVIVTLTPNAVSVSPR